MSLTDIRQQDPETMGRPEKTQGFIFNHTMLRVKDIKKSLAFYNTTLGFTLVDRRDFPEADFSLYFLVILPKGAQIPEQDSERRLWLASQPSVLELTYNHGSEEDGSTYHNGNSEPQGFGHTCISVPDINAACDYFESLGVEFQKRLTDGRMRDLAFIKDPDGYWIEIISNTQPPTS